MRDPIHEGGKRPGGNRIQNEFLYAISPLLSGGERQEGPPLAIHHTFSWWEGVWAGLPTTRPPIPKMGTPRPLDPKRRNPGVRISPNHFGRWGERIRPGGVVWDGVGGGRVAWRGPHSPPHALTPLFSQEDGNAPGRGGGNGIPKQFLYAISPTPLLRWRGPRVSSGVGWWIARSIPISMLRRPWARVGKLDYTGGKPTSGSKGAIVCTGPGV